MKIRLTFFLAVVLSFTSCDQVGEIYKAYKERQELRELIAQLEGINDTLRLLSADWKGKAEGIVKVREFVKYDSGPGELFVGDADSLPKGKWQTSQERRDFGKVEITILDDLNGFVSANGVAEAVSWTYYEGYIDFSPAREEGNDTISTFSGDKEFVSDIRYRLDRF